MSLRFLTKQKATKKSTDRDTVRVATDQRPPKYQFVAPIATSNDESIDSALAVVCPSRERQLDLRIDPAITCLIGDKILPDSAKYCHVRRTRRRKLGEGEVIIFCCE